MLLVQLADLHLLPNLGEGKESYGYDSSAKKAHDSEFTDYGQPFGVDDVIGCYLVSASTFLNDA